MKPLHIPNGKAKVVMKPPPKRTGTTKGKSLRRPTLGQVARGNRMALVGLK